MDSFNLEADLVPGIADDDRSLHNTDKTIVGLLPASFTRGGAERASVQQTLQKSISCTGVGLHTGRKITLRLEPAEAGFGIVFHRSDLDASPVPASYDAVIDTRLSTVIGAAEQPGNRIATVEHLMAALHGCGIDNASIFVDGPEIPVLDGSSADFVFLIDCAGVRAQEAPRREIEILKTVRVDEGDAFAQLSPDAPQRLSLAMSIDFPARAIGRQALSLTLDQSGFRRELAFSRTFTNRQEIEALHAVGLARGGSLSNAIVVENEAILNPTGLRAPDEFVRHKMLDAVGDLYLAGARLHGRFTGHKSGHGLNNRLLRALFADPRAWRWAGSGLTYRQPAPRRAAA
ncbi:UDP-3-O-acyl-N-acetylglucosamine deacetylase [Acetobacter nitrogenifigens]|uniref:UDP-3-O-acyl-N-acetylglucosamine deacetylase n=1 Tax=Acetobacter nitrogenifigens DSM 23921 = NBRC 105050 TaxID=1120919 RepID=A0A511X838_9PROT|nr:UDP-3-O-acyl-N-acetylglucosamine deacetylase [Acetobacter nitrogenifigens]GEN59109.1 UDP-3-O-acyl-N-acetylglucosamine deacetylase [Acetobacter nitrogenifigens DSM 23921 = NBRC 105050]